jgi:hypothetical protein
VLGAGERIAFPKGTRNYYEQGRRLRSEGVRVTNGRVPRRTAADLDELFWKPR